MGAGGFAYFVGIVVIVIQKQINWSCNGNLLDQYVMVINNFFVQKKEGLSHKNLLECAGSTAIWLDSWSDFFNATAFTFFILALEVYLAKLYKLVCPKAAHWNLPPYKSSSFY